MAKKKFDTNQLDPDFPKKAAAKQAEPVEQIEQVEQETVALNGGNVATRIFDDPRPTEDQTRKFQEADFQAYQAPYNGQNVPQGYQPPMGFYQQDTRKRKVAKIGIAENILTALPYIPFFIGLIAGILELAFVPKSEQKVRFHAAQGLAAHIAIFVISAILSGMGRATSFGEFGSSIFGAVTTVMLIVFAVKAYQGKPIHLEWVDDLTNWLEDKIKPNA
ncbi:MAG TPA: hypothetical protein PKM58_01690 [Pyrinomonadaceae bacterium]|nr:hypothetical protein [Pyrinomonadaceae bacterium]HNU07259.1 hypothetical protein [Pyrinomonadaceae bacterium]